MRDREAEIAARLASGAYEAGTTEQDIAYLRGRLAEAKRLRDYSTTRTTSLAAPSEEPTQKEIT